MLKIKKIEFDLTIDLSMYIPGEEGMLKTQKTSPSQLFEWAKFSSIKSDEMAEIEKQNLTGDISSEAMLVKTRDIMVEIIDWFYEKGEDYYNAIHFTTLKEILVYLQEETTNIKKK